MTDAQNITTSIDGTEWEVLKGLHWRTTDHGARKQGYLLRCRTCDSVLSARKFVSVEEVHSPDFGPNCGCWPANQPLPREITTETMRRRVRAKIAQNVAQAASQGLEIRQIQTEMVAMKGITVISCTTAITGSPSMQEMRTET